MHSGRSAAGEGGCSAGRQAWWARVLGGAAARLGVRLAADPRGEDEGQAWLVLALALPLGALANTETEGAGWAQGLQGSPLRPWMWLKYKKVLAEAHEQAEGAGGQAEMSSSGGAHSVQGWQAAALSDVWPQGQCPAAPRRPPHGLLQGCTA